MKTAKTITTQRCKEAIKALETEIIDFPYVPFSDKNERDFIKELSTKANLLAKIDLYNIVLNGLKEN